MIKGMVIPGDMVEEEGVSSDGYRRPSPKEYMFKPLAISPPVGWGGGGGWGGRTPSPEEYVFRPLATPPPNAGKTRKRRKTKEPFYKGYGEVYLPGDVL